MDPAQAHRLRTISPRRRGRPFGPTPLFLDDCFRLDAIELLAKTRGARVDAFDTLAAEQPSLWTLQWTEANRPQARTVSLVVTTTAQPLGGLRRSWRCPSVDDAAAVCSRPPLRPQSRVGCASTRLLG